MRRIIQRGVNLSTALRLDRASFSAYRIGCASGFWGDTAVAAPQLIYEGQIDVLVFDYLSEITMSLLARARSQDPSKGFTPDFINIAQYGKELKRKGIKVIANAGGINPDSCCNELKKAFTKYGVDMKIAVVKGDDLLLNKDLLSHLHSIDANDLPNMSLLSSNVYLGATPIKFALDNGADVVITGRCVDSALTLGPLMHHFKWDDSDIEKLAAGSLAGHLIECGAQVTGGIFTDCFAVQDLWNIGFPIVEVNENGTFIVTKPENTGGIVTTATVSEQLVYEIDNPCSYILPDVICDFSDVTLTEIGKDRVEVRGAKGFKPPEHFKVSSTYLDKYRLTASAIIVGKDAVAKGRLTAENILKRVRGILNILDIPDFSRCNISVIGGEDSYGSSKNQDITKNIREAVIWIAVEHYDQKALNILSSEIAPAGTGMAPGLTVLISGRPKVVPILKLHSSLIDKGKIQVTVTVDSKKFTLPTPQVKGTIMSKAHNKTKLVTTNNFKPSKQVTLRDIAYARSGDKGDICNIGVIARNEESWEIIHDRLSAELVGSHFKHCFPNNDWRGNVDRYELPGIKALNFVLRNSLDGGGVSSLRFDPQGKSFAQMLLDLKI